MAINFGDIRILSFVEAENGPPEDLVQTGRYNLFFDRVLEERRGGVPVADIVSVLFQNLSEVLSAQGPYRGECESILKSRIYGICQSGLSPDTVIDVVNQEKYKFNPQLAGVIEKVHYLLKNRFVSERKDWFLWETRFSHHLGKVVGNLPVMSKAAAYITAGTALFVTGLNKFEPDDPAKGSNTKVGISSMGIGTALLVAPLISAFKASGTSNP